MKKSTVNKERKGVHKKLSSVQKSRSGVKGRMQTGGKTNEPNITDAKHYLNYTKANVDNIENSIQKVNQEVREAKQNIEFASDELEGKGLPFSKGGKLPSIREVEEDGEEISNYSVDESSENPNSGDAILYKYKDKEYQITTWNSSANKHTPGEKEIADVTNEDDEEYRKGGKVVKLHGRKGSTDPSLRPPKEWWNEMKKEVKAGNPSYSNKRIRQTIGNIWYNQLTDSKRAEIRGRYGKSYGPAPSSQTEYRQAAEKGGSIGKDEKNSMTQNIKNMSDQELADYLEVNIDSVKKNRDEYEYQAKDLMLHQPKNEFMAKGGEVKNISFNNWFEENRNSNYLTEEYNNYKYNMELEGIKTMPFKKWAKEEIYEKEQMAKGGKTKSVIKQYFENPPAEIKYKGKTISKLFPSGYYEVHSDKEDRFIKFDDLEMAKEFIDSEINESMEKGGNAPKKYSTFYEEIHEKALSNITDKEFSDWLTQSYPKLNEGLISSGNTTNEQKRKYFMENGGLMATGGEINSRKSELLREQKEVNEKIRAPHQHGVNYLKLLDRRKEIADELYELSVNRALENKEMATGGEVHRGDYITYPKGIFGKTVDRITDECTLDGNKVIHTKDDEYFIEGKDLDVVKKYARGFEKGGEVLLNYEKELNEMTDEKLKEEYENEFGVDAEDRIENEREEVIEELVAHYKRLLKSRGEMDKGGKTNNFTSEQKRKIKEFLKQFPKDTTSWAEATDELPDLHHMMVKIYNEEEPKEKYTGYEGKTNTPSERNTKHREGIEKLLKLMDDKQIDYVYNRHKEWFDRYEQGGQTSTTMKQKIQQKIKDIQSALESYATPENLKEGLKRSISALNTEIQKLEEGDRLESEKKEAEKNKKLEAIKEKKSRTQNSPNKHNYVDIDKRLKEKMRNALHGEKIPYSSKSFDDTFRVFVSNPYQVELICNLYNEKREKGGMAKVNKEDISNVSKQRGGATKFKAKKKYSNLKSKFSSADKKRHELKSEEMAKGGKTKNPKEIKKRLEKLRKELRAERISYGELSELQSLAKYIDPSDIELLEAAGREEKFKSSGSMTTARHTKQRRGVKNMSETE